MFALLKAGGFIAWIIVGSLASIVVFAALILRDVLGDIFLGDVRKRRMERMVAEAKEEVRQRQEGRS